MNCIDHYERRILVIDDNPNIHEDFKMILEKEDTYKNIDKLAAEYFNFYLDNKQEEPAPEYVLDFAIQGEDGVQMVQKAIDEKSPYMIAFVDMRIPPGIDGFETMKRIIKIDPDIQIVLCTAYSDYSAVDIYAGVGKTSNLLILKKPFDSSEIEQLALALTEKWILSKKWRLKEDELNQIIEKRTIRLSRMNKILELEIFERKKAEKGIKILTQENIRIQEKERQRIARDLHDSVAQDLAALLISQESILKNTTPEMEDIQPEIRKCICVLKSTINNVRNISYNLRPPSLNEFGLVHAMRQHCKSIFANDDVKISFFSSDMENKRFDGTIEINLYRIFQEAISNIKKHAFSKSVVIRLSATSKNIVLIIKDDGIGFDTEERLNDAILERRMGLKGIEERVSLLNGEFEINAIPSRGTELIVRVPEKPLSSDKSKW